MAGCDLNGCCTDGNSTRDELESWTHNSGGRHEAPPFLGACTTRARKHNAEIQINYGVGWHKLLPSDPITSTDPDKTGLTNSPSCIRNIPFTLSAKAGSGGSTYSCRAKHYQGIFTYYCYFDVTVNAPPVTDVPRRTLLGTGL